MEKEIKQKKLDPPALNRSLFWYILKKKSQTIWFWQIFLHHDAVQVPQQQSEAAIRM